MKTPIELLDGGRAPNPRRVRIFMAEKGLALPLVQIDINKLEQKTAAFTRMNPMQRVPVLVFNDGSVIAESVAICRYLEEMQPEPNLMGRDAFERAEIEMWNRRVELGLFYQAAQVFRHLHPAMVEMEVPQVREWGEANKPKILESLAFLNSELDSRPFVAGSRYTIADITAQVAVDFLKPNKMAVPDELTNLRRWHEAVRARPSATA